jgi:glycine/D-amino acid oxidase-like deaminating enzyme
VKRAGAEGGSRAGSPERVVPGRSDARSSAVIGGGILGLTTALLLARHGRRVTIIDRRTSLWAGTSAVGEGKIHLGPVYALGDRATHELMLRGALTFGPTIEASLDRRLPWEALTSSPFEYLVMPSSMAAAGRLAASYRQMNDTLASVAGGQPSALYLGERLNSLIDTVPRRDPVTGLEGFRSRERAIDSGALGRLMTDAATAHPDITVMLGTPIVAVDADTGRVTVERDGRRESLGPFRSVVNCAWDGRSRLAHPGAGEGILQNIRVKMAVRLRPGPVATARAVTLVQGPFGDIVAHPEHWYASWYPIGRIHHESGVHPSPRVAAAVATGASARHLARAQLDALAEIGLLRGDEEIVSVDAGVILGDGTRDIDRIDSGLHRRAGFGALARGRLITPMNYKLTTAPLAAADACERALALSHA